MPSCSGESYAARVARRKAREAKLRKLGIIPASTKWFKLMNRRRS